MKIDPVRAIKAQNKASAVVSPTKVEHTTINNITNNYTVAVNNIAQCGCRISDHGNSELFSRMPESLLRTILILDALRVSGNLIDLRG